VAMILEDHFYTSTTGLSNYTGFICFQTLYKGNHMQLK